MRKLRKKQTVLLFILLILTCLLLIVVDEAFARAGGGGGGGAGGGGGGGGHGGRGGKGETLILDLFVSCYKTRGFATTLLLFSPLILFHFISCFAASFYYKEKDLSRVLFFLGAFFFGGIFCFSFFGTIFLVLPIECVTLKTIIESRIKYGCFITYNEEQSKKFSTDNTPKEKLALMKIKKNNPSFSLTDFKTRIKKAFKIIQDSWMGQDLSNAEMFLADGTYEQFQIQINGMIKDNTVDIMKELEIQNVFAIKAENSFDYDSIYVAIQAKAINYLMNKRTKAIIKGDSTEPELFAEVWCFMRRKGAKELNSKGLIEGYCPNCGTHIEGARLIQCSSCNALLKSGQHDWILAGIYQSSEWRDTHNSHIPGLKNLYKYDPSFNIQNIEDKLSAIFWRMIEAVRNQSADSIFKISSDKFAQDFIKSSFKHKEISRYNKAGTDSVEIIGISEEDGKHVLLGQVIWNSCITRNDKEETIHQKSVFVLKRDINTKTDTRKCFCSSHCISCGAAETFNSSNYCEYCNTAVNDDKKDWILTEICNISDALIGIYLNQANNYDKKEVAVNPEKTAAKKDQIIAEPADYGDSTEEEYEDDSLDINFWSLLGKYSVKDLLRMCIAVMLADGVIDKNELQIIRKICEIGYIPEEVLQMNIREMQNADNPIEHVLETSAIGLDKDLLKLLIKIAVSDGDVAKSEVDIIFKMSEKMNVSRNETIDSINNIYEKRWKRKLNQSIFSQRF